MGSGVPLSRFRFAPRPADGTVRCLFVGRLRSLKGVRVFVDAARMLAAESSIYSFAILGPHDPESPDSVDPEDLKTWVSQGIVEYLGFTDRVEEVLPEYDVVVFPSLYGEGMPRTLMEAAAMGKIGVTSDTPGCREAVTPESGYVLSDVTVEAVCRAIRDYASKDTASRRAMASAARRLAEGSFSDESNIQAYVEAAEQVMAARVEGSRA
jgi:glycosyltransferase involved in cell wall biosynthesis